MDEIDRKLLAMVQDCFPLTPRPFLDIGIALGLEEKEVIERLAVLQKEGLVRRIGPILDLRKLGRSGILAALQVPLEEADGAAEVVNEYQEVSHNYLRPNESGYNLWFTVSASEERIQEILQEIKMRTGRRCWFCPRAGYSKLASNSI